MTVHQLLTFDSQPCRCAACRMPSVYQETTVEDGLKKIRDFCKSCHASSTELRPLCLGCGTDGYLGDSAHIEKTCYCGSCYRVRDKIAAIVVSRDKAKDARAAYVVADAMMQARKRKPRTTPKTVPLARKRKAA